MLRCHGQLAAIPGLYVRQLVRGLAEHLARFDERELATFGERRDLQSVMRPCEPIDVTDDVLDPLHALVRHDRRLTGRALPDAGRPCEHEVGKVVLPDVALDAVDDVLVPDDVVEGLRPVLLDPDLGLSGGSVPCVRGLAHTLGHGPAADKAPETSGSRARAPARTWAVAGPRAAS